MIGNTISRYRSIVTRLCSLLFFSVLLTAQEWWETKPYIQWSVDQVYKILNDSPWVSLIPAGVRQLDKGPVTGSIAIQTSDGRVLGGYGSYPTLPDNPTGGSDFLPLFYRIRLVTARPVREALLRRIASDQWIETSVSVKDYETDTEKDRIERFIATYPDDVRVRGDQQYLIIAITLRTGHQDVHTRGLAVKDQNWFEEPNADELSKIDASTLAAETSLTADAKRVALDRYEPPGRDGLGAKYYFPRKLSNGAPLIAAADKKLTFETRIRKSKVKAEFNLSKMSYNGKPET